MSHLAETASHALSRPSRPIRVWGSVARLVVGLAALIAVAFIGPSRVDLVLALTVLPVVQVGILAAVLWRVGPTCVRSGLCRL